MKSIITILLIVSVICENVACLRVCDDILQLFHKDEYDIKSGERFFPEDKCLNFSNEYKELCQEIYSDLMEHMILGIKIQKSYIEYCNNITMGRYSYLNNMHYDEL